MEGNEINKLILLVEDDDLTFTIIKLFFKKHYNIIHVDSADKAMEALNEENIDLILMDITIRGNKNGLELTKDLKNSEKYSHIPIIAVTAYAFEQDKKNALEAGCNDYITKPFKKESLISLVEKYIL